jgi:hypothetical protein
MSGRGPGENTRVTGPADLPADLQVFLASDFTVSDSGDLAYRELFVEEQVLGRPTSRFIKEGGVHFVDVKSYMITVEQLEAMAIQQRGLPSVQLELLKFFFTIDQLPPSRHYTSVTVWITLDPAVPAFLLEPDLETATTDLEKTFSAEFAAEVARLLQVHLAGGGRRTIRRIEQQPVTTAINHGRDGFGWIFQAQDGAPLFPHGVITMALVELPRGTRQLAGLFDTEALISRKVLTSLVERPTVPVNAAKPFTVDLTAKPFSDLS